jgi:hypothetical protein
LTWYFPAVFAPGRTRDILYTYDGSNLSLFIDGKEQPLTYRLGPGTALAKLVRRVKSGELEGYSYIYPPPRGAASFWLASAFLIPAALLEWILVSTSGRSFSPKYLGLSLLLAVGSFLWVNSDRSFLLRD